MLYPASFPEKQAFIDIALVVRFLKFLYKSVSNSDGPDGNFSVMITWVFVVELLLAYRVPAIPHTIFSMFGL
jgi:hypothetical protein